MISSVIFDLDGTLIDSSEDVYGCLKKAFNKADIAFKLKSIKPVMGQPLPGMIRSIAPNIVPEKTDLIVSYFKSFYDSLPYKGTRLYKGVKPLLHSLSGKGIKLFVATNKRMIPTKKILCSLGIYDRFNDVYTFDMNKNAPLSKSEMLGLILKDHGLNNRNTILAGDNESDIMAARKNHCISVAFLGGYGEPKDLLKARPSHTIKKIGDLHKLIIKLNCSKGG